MCAMLTASIYARKLMGMFVSMGNAKIMHLEKFDPPLSLNNIKKDTGCQMKHPEEIFIKRVAHDAAKAEIFYRQ